jgi:hypothetical protein
VEAALVTDKYAVYRLELAISEESEESEGRSYDSQSRRIEETLTPESG